MCVVGPLGPEQGSSEPAWWARSARLMLGDEPYAARRARRWVVDQLAAAGLDALTDDARVVVGELVANGLLQAGPPVEVAVFAGSTRARVEVRDRSPLPPVLGQGGVESMTGRGLRIVDRVARTWGADRLEDGKAVWAEFDSRAPAEDGAAEQPPSGVVARWGPEDEPAGQMVQRHTVRLAGVPTDLLLAAKAHVDDLVRESQLTGAGARFGAGADVPGPLAETLASVVGRFSDARQQIKRQALIAAEAGRSHVTLELSLPVEAADAGEEYLQALDEADAYCRAARLLTLETPPQQRVFRRWYVEELIGHLRRAARGEPARPPQTFEQRLLAELDTVARAERTAERSARLNSLTAALAAAVTPRQVAQCAIREGIEAMRASGGGLLMATGPATLSVPATVGYDEELTTALRHESADADLPAAYAARAGEPVWLESPEEVRAQFPALLEFEPGTVALCALPLTVGGRHLGALRFSFSRPHLFDAEERRFASSLAAQASQALERSLLYHEQAETVRRLQQKLLPPALPHVPGVDVAKSYDPAESLDLGGDFYDLISVAGDWTVVVGDVRGKGIEAAALTAMARHTVRTAALSGFAPDAILGLLNSAFLAEQGPETFCTAVCAQLSLQGDEALMTIACGGHPEPLVVRADGQVAPIACHGMLVGAFPGVIYQTTTSRLQEGDLVLFYTDGVTEARRNGELFGRQRLEEALVASRGADAETTIARIHEAVEAFQTRQHDDIAMLALRLPPGRRSDATG